MDISSKAIRLKLMILKLIAKIIQLSVRHVALSAILQLNPTKCLLTTKEKAFSKLIFTTKKHLWPLLAILMI